MAVAKNFRQKAGTIRVFFSRDPLDPNPLAVARDCINEALFRQAAESRNCKVWDTPKLAHLDFSVELYFDVTANTPGARSFAAAVLDALVACNLPCLTVAVLTDAELDRWQTRHSGPNFLFEVQS